ncbi:MAG TPA: 6-pyruvoyl-tetrahydropterin synthase-related protein [Patescibacteria group bacterium]
MGKFLRKNQYIVLLALVVFFSLFPIVGIFVTPKLLHTHDGFAHLARIGAYFKALQDFEFPVRWAGDLNYGYGMPIFNFMYQTPYFIASLFLLTHMGLVNAFKVTLALSFILSGIFMFGFAKEAFNDYKKAFLVAIFYQFAPFRLIELLVRGAFGEVYTYAFLPLVLWGIALFVKKQAYKSFLLISLATALLVLSHNALSLVFFGICFVYTFLFAQNKNSFFKTLLALGIGLLLSAYYWFPAIIEHKYTYGDLFMKTLYLEHFPPIQNFFIPNFFNSSYLQTGGISVQLGLFHVIAIIFSLFLLFRKNTEKFIKRLTVVNIFLLLITFFFMQPISIPVWVHVALLRQFQFSWRLLGIVAFITSILSVSYLYFKVFTKQWIYIVLVTLTIITTAYYWKPPLGYDVINEKYFWNFPLTSTYFGETDVIWSAGPAKAYPKSRIEFVQGAGKITKFVKHQTTQTFTVKTTSKAVLVSNTEYFPGWRVFVNGEPVAIQFQDPNWRGLITFAVPKGESTVQIVFGETPLRLGADIASLSAIVLLFAIGIARKKLFYENKKK